VSTTNEGNDPKIIFQSDNQATARPLAPPEYRDQALRFIINLNRSKGLSSLSFSELALQLRDQTLRGKVDPSFEPLSLESIHAAVTDLNRSGDIIINNRTVIFP
jgi:hypothetical protein